MIVTCKKWHVAKRLIYRLRDLAGIPVAEYLFNEESAPLPDLGGIQKTMAKRTRHRRALLRMLFDYWNTDRLVICIDPANLDLIEDFTADKARVRVLEIDCSFSDDYLLGHARRVGLAGDNSPPEVVARVLPTIRHDIRFESDRLRDADLEDFHRIRQEAGPEENAIALGRFFGIAPDAARALAETDHLFVD